MNDQEITPEQKDQLNTWAGQRDAILLEISNLELEQEKIKTENINLTSSSTDIHDRMKVIQGRIDELEKQEAKLPLLISKEVANLESKKTLLESEVTNLGKIITILVDQKASLEEDVSFALSAFDTVKDEALLLHNIVGHVTEVSGENIKKIDDLVIGLSKSLEEIIEVNKKNVYETNIVINKVPAMIMEAQKHGLIKNKI